MVKLGEYMNSSEPEWEQIKIRAYQHNGWFTPIFIEEACYKIATLYLQEDLLQEWTSKYKIDDAPAQQKNVGIVMAGNIPLVGFHDFLSVFITGHRQTLKLSAKDNVLLKHLIDKLAQWNEDFEDYVAIEEMLKGCDAYIATGSNNSSRYFEQYFARFPHIIRKNRTSVALINGTETAAELDKLSDDIHLYFGLGCRNVSKIFVPRDYDFIPLLKAFERYGYFADHHKYKNNYDYQLSIILLNNIYYMTNGSTLLTENEGLFSPISHLFYEYYEDVNKVLDKLQQNEALQCIICEGHTDFGEAQNPGLLAYADGVDTMQFLQSLESSTKALLI